MRRLPDVIIRRSNRAIRHLYRSDRLIRFSPPKSFDLVNVIPEHCSSIRLRTAAENAPKLPKVSAVRKHGERFWHKAVQHGLILSHAACALPAFYGHAVATPEERG